MAGLDETNTPEDAPLESPLCQHLRSKKFFFLESLPLSEKDIIGPDNHCWCRRTMQVVGPDGGRVRPGLCGAGRECYLSQFA